MSNPIYDLFDDPEFRKLAAQDTQARYELKSLDLQRMKQEYQDLIDNPDTPQSVRLKHKAVIAKIDKQLKSGKYNPEDKNRGVMENLGRGAVEGLATGLPGAADLLLAIPDKLGSTTAHGAREKLQNLMLDAQQVYDGQGTAGTVGQIAGGIVSSAPILGPVSGTLGRIGVAGLRAAGAARAAGAIESGLSAANPISRGLAHVATGTPLNLMQQVQLPSDASMRERLKAAAIGVGGDFVGGALFGKGKKSEPAKPSDKIPEQVQLVDGPTPTGADALASIKEKSVAINAQKETEKATRSLWSAQMREQARDAWKTENPDGVWTLLPKEKRAELERSWKEKNPFDEWAKAQGDKNAVQPVQPSAPAVEPVAQPVEAAKGPEASSGVLDPAPAQEIQLTDPSDQALTYLEKRFATEPTGEYKQHLAGLIEQYKRIKAEQATPPVVTSDPKMDTSPVEPTTQPEPVVTSQEIPATSSIAPIENTEQLIAAMKADFAAQAGKPLDAVPEASNTPMPPPPPALEVPPVATSATTPAPVPELTVAQANSARSWWNKLDPKARQSALDMAGQESGVVKVRTNMRWDALSEQGKQSALKAFEKTQGIDAAPVATTPPQVVAPEVLKTTPYIELQAKLKTALDSGDSAGYDTIMTELQSRPEFTGGVEIKHNKIIVDQAAPEINWTKARRPGQLSNDELVVYHKEVARQLENTTDPNMRAERNRVLDKLSAERDKRATDGTLKLESPHEIGGAVVGGIFGATRPAESEEERNRNIFMWAAIGGFGAYAGKKVFETLSTRDIVHQPPEMIPGLSKMQTGVVTTLGQDAKVPLKQQVSSGLRNFYIGTVRNILPLENTIKTIGDVNPPMAKLANQFWNMFGYYISATESWMNNKLVFRGVDGEPVYFDGLPVRQILGMVDHDIEGVGTLWTALTSEELASRGYKVPMDELTRNKIISNAPANYMEAVRQFRKLHLALLDVQVMTGRLTPEAKAIMAQEEWYGPMYHMYEDGRQSNLRYLQGDQYRISQKNNLFPREGGSNVKIKNPVEATMELIPSVLRSAEYGQSVKALLDLVRSVPDKEVRQALVTRIKPRTKEHVAMMKEIEQRVLEGASPEITSDQLREMANQINPNDTRLAGGYITHWENGVLNTYKVNNEIFTAMRSMLPIEKDILTNFFSRGASMLGKGVVFSPTFIFNQFIKDPFQAMVMSRYGFRPVIDNVRGWWHVATESPEYKTMLDMGGPGTVQSLKFLNAAQAIKAVEAEGGNALATAWKQVKELHPVEAYKTLMMPLVESSRVGEYLRALDHGATTLEATYAAWNVLGNTRIQGSAVAMRALNQMTPFLRASISASDEMAFRAGIHPFRVPHEGRAQAALSFATKSIAGITIPSMLLWWINKDDKEITQFRQTTAGQRFWWVRGPDGTLVRIPRAHSVGVIFGAGIEQVLDQAYAKNPNEIKSFFEAWIQDVALNVVPTVVNTALGVTTGYDVNRGQEIVPKYDEGVDPKYQGHESASVFARAAGQTLGGSPYKWDFAIRSLTGILGEDVGRVATAAFDYADAGYVPAVSEYPFIGKFFHSYPEMNIRPIRDFYSTSERVQEVSRALTHLTMENPTAAAKYLQDNMQYVELAETFNTARKQIADLRRAAADIKNVQRGYVSSEKQRELQKLYAKQMVIIAEQANAVAKQIIK